MQLKLQKYAKQIESNHFIENFQFDFLSTFALSKSAIYNSLRLKN